MPDLSKWIRFEFVLSEIQHIGQVASIVWKGFKQPTPFYGTRTRDMEPLG